MHLATDELLSVARAPGPDAAPDPGSARAREHLAGCAACRAELDRLLALRARLAALPPLAPPADGWARVIARADARDPRLPGGAAVLAAGFAAAVVVVALALGLSLGGAPGPADPPLAVDDPAAAAAGDVALEVVLAENARLEALLAALPDGSRVRARSAYTVTALEDRLALVDDALSAAAFEPLAPGSAEQLWRERLYLMNSLVKVRYGQATAGL